MGVGKSSAVDLSDKKLTEIPEEVLQKCGTIRELDLSRNTGICLTNAIGRFNNLRKLMLCKCGLLDIPEEIGTLTKIEVLNLSQNLFGRSLSVFPPGRTASSVEFVGRLRHLKNLNLRRCALEYLPDSFEDLKELTILNLRGNCLTQYPPCIINLKTLKTLDISQQQEPPFKPIERVRKHEKILIERNKERRQYGISSLPMKLADTNLRELILDGNPITNPPEAIWRQGLDAIKSYFREKRFGAGELCPDTINMIGDVFSGKTSIAQSLVRGFPSRAAADDRTRVMQQFRAGFGENGKLLVNINDFGGHPIYHSVIPIFLPNDGLTILAYDMSVPVKEQESAVSRWLLTAIAKLKNIRLTVAGTRWDRISKLAEIQDVENNMLQFVSSLLNDVKREIRLNINRLEQRSSNSDVKKVIHLQDLSLRLENADISVVSLSCCVSTPGLAVLRYNVSQKLRQKDSMPLRWLRFMKSISHAPSNRPYLTWSEVQRLYRNQVPDTESDNDLVVILRYLVSASQILWLEHHEKLKEFVFHSPQSILKICKDVLSHDHAQHVTKQLVAVTDKDRERYLKGIVQRPFMMELISDKEVALVAIEFLKNFNLISEIAAGDGTVTYVIPSNLPAEEPPLMRDLEQRLQSCPNSVAINLIFLGSVLPMSFFETSLSLMLTIATRHFKDGMSTDQWRHGLIILYDRVCFTAKRSNNILTLAASSEVWTSNPWAILLPIVKGIHENITASWHGATPESSLLCPACRISGRPERAIGENEITLETFLTKIQHKGANWMCPKCAETIPLCLCFPLPIDSLNADELDELKTFFTKHGMSVSGGNYQTSATSITPSSVDSSGCLDLQSKYEVLWTAVSDDDARATLRKSYCKLTALLKCVEVTDILFTLEILSSADHEKIQSTRDVREARRHLVDTVRTRGQPGLKAFAEALLETRQCEVHKMVMQSLRKQVPQAFETETARSFP